jgi:predicted GIY-YIG superfamily endonuclease
LKFSVPPRAERKTDVDTALRLVRVWIGERDVLEPVSSMVAWQESVINDAEDTINELTAELAEARAEIEELRARDATSVVAGETSPSQYSLDTRGWFVYVLHGQTLDDVIYVGLSTNVLARVGTHMGSRDRRHLIERVTFIRCASKEEMRRREYELIRRLRPRLNILGVPFEDVA